jgi:hypothetical protein
MEIDRSAYASRQRFQWKYGTTVITNTSTYWKYLKTKIEKTKGLVKR